MPQQTFSRLCQIILLVATVLTCSGAFAQSAGCGMEPYNWQFYCYYPNGKYLTEPGSWCNGGADPEYYCSLSYSTCPPGTTGEDITRASYTYDPLECGGGGGCSGGCLESGCPPDYSCDASTCSCVYYYGEYEGAVNRSNGARGRRGNCTAFHEKGTADLAGVPNSADVRSDERNTLGGGTMRISPLLLAGVCMVPMLCAQPATTPVANLRTTAISGTPVGHKVLADGNDDITCDAAGNIYFLSEDPGAKPGRLPIQEVTAEAKWGSVFRVPDSILGAARGVFVTPDGIVYRLVQGAKGSPPKYTDRGYYVLQFAPDGSVRAETKLELQPNRVSAWHLAVFKSGEFLVAGAVGEDPHDPFYHQSPFTAVFARDGKLVKKIYEPEDEEARQKGEVDWVQGEVQDNSRNFVYAGGAAAGSDGNVYLLRGGYPSLVYVISPAGEVIRKLRVDAGSRDRIAQGIKFYDGRLAIGFDAADRADQELIKVIDLNGNLVADYGVGGAEASRLACYGPEGFTMLPTGLTTLHLLKAKP